jgi:hypothetical protein
MPDYFVVALAMLTVTSLIAGGSLWKRPEYWYLSVSVLLTAGAILFLVLLQGSADLDTALALFGLQLMLGTIHLTLFFALVIAHASERERRESARQHAAWLAERRWPDQFYP